jgi:hypothetical protein
VLHGRYTKAASGTIKLKGKIAGQLYERSIAVNLPDAEAANDVLATLWARTRIDDISSGRLKAATPAKGAELDKQITNIGLEFRLMTQFTSFVAVEDRIVNQNGKPVTVQVPVELPAGTSARENVIENFWRRRDPNGVIASSNGTGSGSGGASLPVNARQVSQLATLSAGVVNASAAQVVTVTADSSAIDTTSSSVTTVMRPDANGNFRVVTGGGGGGGYGSGRGSGSGGDAKPTPEKKKKPRTPEEIKEARLKEKLHSWLYAVVARLAEGDAKPTPNELMFVHDGKAEIQIELTVRSAELIEKLKAAGFEVVSEKGKTIVFGRIAIEKLAALVEIEEVKLILPKI